MKKRKAVSLLLTACMVTTMAAGYSNGAAAASGNTGRITEDGRTKVIVGTTNNTGSLDPLVSAQSANRKDMDFLVFETLYIQLEDCSYVPVMAKERVDIDTVTSQITIYDYIYDTAGNQITAADVVWCYEQEAQNGVITTLESIEQIDDFTVEITVNKEIAGVMDAALSAVTIVSRDSYEASSDSMASDPVGTGPYKLVEFNNGTGSVWEINEDYWQTDDSLRSPLSMQNVEVIEFQIIGDKSQVSTALQTGTIDISDCLLSSDAPSFEEGGANSEGMTVDMVAKNLKLMLQFNCSEDSPFNNINLRKAISYCYDVTQLAIGAENGYALCSGGDPYGSYFFLYDEDNVSYTYSYDADLAKEYLEAFESETGISASSLTITILANSNNSAPCELLGAFLTMLGINYELQMLDQAVVNTTLTDSSAWDVYVAEWSITSSAMDKTYNIFGKANNVMFLDDDTLEELLDVAANPATSTEETVSALYDYISEQCYAVGLYQRCKLDTYQDWISDIVHNASLNIAINCCTFDFGE